MAISKRLRFEILRRDNFQCRYCGAKPPEAELRVDHVKPEALGGSNEPENLVASCEPCNSGKSSVALDGPVVADIERDAIRWAQAIRVAADAMVEEQWAIEQRNAAFQSAWATWTYGGAKKIPVPLPGDWVNTVDRLRAAGLSDQLLSQAVTVAMSAQHVEPENTFRYFCGVAWRMVGDLQDRARAIVETYE